MESRFNPFTGGCANENFVCFGLSENPHAALRIFKNMKETLLER